MTGLTPLLAMGALAWVGVLAMLPRRERDSARLAALAALTAVQVGLGLAPAGLALGLVWAAEGMLSLAVLPAGPARRLAAPWLLLAGGFGAVGAGLGGVAGGSLVLLAVAIRLGVPPFHSWIVGAWTLGPTTWAVALACPMAAFAFLARTPLGESPWLGGPVTIGISLAAGLAAALALVQRELTRAVGLLAASVASSVLVGMIDTDPTGHLGAMMMWGLTATALVGLGGVTVALRSRLGPVDVSRFGGRVDSAPALAILFLVFGMAAVGAPGTADFVSGELVLHGGLAHHPAALLLYAGVLSLQAYVVLHLFLRVFYGPPPAVAVPDATPRERVAFTLLAAVLVLGGLAPQVWIDGWLVTEAPGVYAP